MPTDAAPTPLPAPLPDALPQGSFMGRAQFQQHVRDALAAAAQQGWRELILCDASFADWPLGDRAVVQSLQAWALGGGQQCTLLARQYEEVRRLHPLFVRWRVQWAHKIDSRACPQADASDFPSVLLAPGWALQRQDVLRHSGLCGPEAERRTLLREGLNEILTRSTPGFAATTLGL